MFVVVAGVFNTWWTGRVTVRRRGAGFGSGHSGSVVDRGLPSETR